MADLSPIDGERLKQPAKLSGKRGIVATTGTGFDLFCRFLPLRPAARTRIERERPAD
jgi:hypothetical protein